MSLVLRYLFGGTWRCRGDFDGTDSPNHIIFKQHYSILFQSLSPGLRNFWLSAEPMRWVFLGSRDILRDLEQP